MIITGWYIETSLFMGRIVGGSTFSNLQTDLVPFLLLVVDGGANIQCTR